VTDQYVIQRVGKSLRITSAGMPHLTGLNLERNVWGDVSLADRLFRQLGSGTQARNDIPDHEENPDDVKRAGHHVEPDYHFAVTGRLRTAEAAVVVNESADFSR
jgi:hypothetical protein